jgi:WD40 repeat protein
MLVSGSLDNTVKMWDIETGVAVRTLFGHIEGVWAVACDRPRLVSGSHDRTVKVSIVFFHWPGPLMPPFRSEGLELRRWELYGHFSGSPRCCDVRLGWGRQDCLWE